MSKQHYWFKVVIGKWENDEFDPESSFVFIEAWDAGHAVRKAGNNIDIEQGEVIVAVLYLGYPQV